MIIVTSSRQHGCMTASWGCSGLPCWHHLSQESISYSNDFTANDCNITTLTHLVNHYDSIARMQAPLIGAVIVVRRTR